jgi:hypothetical protein
MFDEHEDLRRAGTECICNMVQNEDVNLITLCLTLMTSINCWSLFFKLLFLLTFKKIKKGTLLLREARQRSNKAISALLWRGRH